MNIIKNREEKTYQSSGFVMECKCGDDISHYRSNDLDYLIRMANVGKKLFNEKCLIYKENIHTVTISEKEVYFSTEGE